MKTLPILMLGLTVAFNATAQNNDTSTILIPKIGGQPFRIDCDRDFPYGKPTAYVLGRLDSHIHGFVNNTDDNINLFEASDRTKRVEQLVNQSFSFNGAILKNQMLASFNKYDASPDKEQFLRDTLFTQHKIDDTFYATLAERCQP